MIREPQINRGSLADQPKLPSWVASTSTETPEDTAFVSGAAFAMLNMILTQKDEAVPKRLLANRLSLKAATATSKLEGRLGHERDIRDAYHLHHQMKTGCAIEARTVMFLFFGDGLCECGYPLTNHRSNWPKLSGRHSRQTLAAGLIRV